MYIGKSFLIFMYYGNVYRKNPHTAWKERASIWFCGSSVGSWIPDALAPGQIIFVSLTQGIYNKPWLQYKSKSIKNYVPDQQPIPHRSSCLLNN